MMHEEAYPEAAAVLRDAGWKPHDGYGVYTRDTLVMGFQPDGQAFHAKNWAAITEGHPQWGPDTPDTPEEAAAWLVERFKPNPLTTEATLEPLAAEVLTDEVHAPEHPESEQTGEAAEPIESAVGGGADAFAAEDTGGAEDGSASGGGALQPYDGQDGASDGDREYAFDADYEEAGEELGAELLDVESEAVSFPALEGADPEDFAPDPIEPEPESDQARFYGLDDLDRVKRLRIGDVAAEAAVRIAAIEAGVGEREGEYAAVQSFVVTNLDKFTGAFTLQDDASQTTARRFYELDAARSQIAVVDRKRKETTAWLLDPERTRDDVVNFDVQAAFA